MSNKSVKGADLFSQAYFLFSGVTNISSTFACCDTSPDNESTQSSSSKDTGIDDTQAFGTLPGKF